MMLLNNLCYSQAALDSMLTACYPFTGNAQDMSGNNHHGIAYGGALTTDRFGNQNCAYHFDGVSSYIEVQHFDSLAPTDEFSISFWLRVNTFASHAQFQIQPDDASDRFNISVHYSHNGIPSTFWDYGSIFTTGRIDTLNMPFVTQWEHYVFISSASLDFMAEYKDGVLVKKVYQHDVITNKMKPLWIGRGSTLACLDGEIDDIRMYNRVLNDSDISALYLLTDICTVSPVAGFVAPNHICPGTCTNFTNTSQNGSTYLWNFPGGSPSVSTDLNPANVCYNTPGQYDVTLITSNASGSDTLLLSNFLTVFAFPNAQSIIQNGDTLFANPGAMMYQWYYNGNIINGATNYFYLATQSGNYDVVSTDENGCEVEAVINNVIASSQFAVPSLQLAIVPNPVTTTIDIRGLKNNSADEIKIFNVFGEKVFSAVHCQLPINCQFSPGLYFIEIISDKKIYRTKFLKQ
jgi:hypothetical protein